MFFFFKQKTAYEMRISDWSSDVCSSDLLRVQMEIKENQTQLDFFKDQQETLRTHFNALLNRRAAEPVTVADSIHTVLLGQEREALLDSVLQHNPELNRLHREDAALESRIKVAKKSGMPTFDMAMSYAKMEPQANQRTEEHTTE